MFVKPTLSAHALFTSLATILVAMAFVLIAPADAVAQCAVCQTCVADAECPQGYVCRNLGTPAGTRCTQVGCSIGTCPGDSVCYTFTINGMMEQTCLNPNAETVGNCPANYTCTDDGMTCTGLGTDCSAGPATCSQLEAATCLTETNAQGASRSYCTCTCTDPADCDGNACVAVSGSMLCQDTGGNTGLCAGVMCATGETCDPGTGNCVVSGDLCANVVCSGGAICSPATGTCIGGSPSDMTMGMDMAVGNDTSMMVMDPGSAPDTSIGLPDMGTGSDVNVTPGSFVITSISPSSGPNDMELLVQINGSGFVAGTTFRLGPNALTNIMVASSTFATSTVPAGIGPSVYDLHGQLPDGTIYTLPGAYQVTAPGTTVGGDTGGADDGCGCQVRSDAERSPTPLGLLIVLGALIAVSRSRRRTL